VAWPDWIRTIEVEPSLYGADFAHLGHQIEQLLRAECRVFHFDIGDGHFIEPVTIGPVVLQSISPLIHRSEGVLDVHLMVENPAKYFEPVAAAGGDSVTFHYEAVDDVAATIHAARERGLGVGVAFNPESEPEEVAAASGDADLVLCMAIHPGYSGQEFREATYDRVRRLRRALGKGIHIQVDGGVGAGNIKRIHDCGATLFVAATAVFGQEDLAGAYRSLARALA
jgi:ribulose-phosphate 3-epimerase